MEQNFDQKNFEFPPAFMYYVNPLLAQRPDPNPEAFLASMNSIWLSNRTINEIEEHKDRIFALANAIRGCHSCAVRELERGNDDTYLSFLPTSALEKLHVSRQAAVKVFATQSTFERAVRRLDDFVSDVLAEKRFRCDGATTAIYKHTIVEATLKEEQLRENMTAIAEPIVGPAFGHCNTPGKEHNVERATKGYIGELSQRHVNLAKQMVDLQEVVENCLRIARGRMGSR